MRGDVNSPENASDLLKQFPRAVNWLRGRADPNVEYPPFQMWSLDLGNVRGEQTRRSAEPGANSQTSHPGLVVSSTLWSG